VNTLWPSQRHRR